jgi:hypothetical protein
LQKRLALADVLPCFVKTSQDESAGLVEAEDEATNSVGGASLETITVFPSIFAFAQTHFLSLIKEFLAVCCGVIHFTYWLMTFLIWSMGTARLLWLSGPVTLTAPNFAPLVTVPEPLLLSLATCRKLLVSVALPSTIGLPLVRMAEEETSTLGAAILASVRCGDHPDIPAAAAAMVRFGRRFEPDPKSAPAYERAFALYNELYRALAPVFHAHSH